MKREAIWSFHPRFNLYIILCSVFFLWFCLLLPAQSTIEDSLKNIVAKTQDDLARLEEVNRLALEISAMKPDVALQMIEDIYSAVVAIGHSPLTADVFYTKGRIYEKRRQLDSALVNYEAARNLALANRDKADVSSSLIQIGYVYHEKNESRKGLKFLKEGLATAKEAKDKALESKAANGIGRLYSFLSEFDSSNIYLNHALDIKKKLGAKREVAEIYTNIANNYGVANQREKAIEYFRLSQALMRELNDVAGISHTFRNIGVTYFFDGNYPEALSNIHQSIQATEGTNLHEEIITSLDYVAEVYMTIEDYENALLYWEKAMEAWTRANGQKINPDFLFKKGRVLLLKEDYKEALTAFLETEKLKKETGQAIGGDLYWNLGQAYEMLSDYDSAKSSYIKAEELSQSTTAFFIKIKSLYGLGKIYENQGDIDKALSFYNRAYDIASKNGYKENEMAAAAGLYQIYKQQNNTFRALRFLEISTRIQDSLFNERNTKEIARMQAGFEFEKEKRELEFARQRERRQQANIRRFLWMALVILAGVLFIGYRYYRSKQIANAELARLNAQILQQKEKLEALDQTKSRFFTNISHEFRTPLTIISGMIDQINEKPDLWLERGVKMIKRNAAGLLNLVNQILDLRKLESNELKLEMIQGDAVKYIRYVAELHESYAAHKGLQLHYLPSQAAINMDYDSEKLLRIVSNLLSNAIKYTPEGGDVYLLVDKKTTDGQSLLHIRVQDTGEGVPLEDLPHIFDRFYQADGSTTRRGEGTGVGLALTKELVKLLGGKIKAENTVGKGAIFHVELPIANNSAIPASGDFELSETKALFEKAVFDPVLANPEAIISAGGIGKEGKPRLLIVEDNSDVQEYLVACLEGEYQLILAENGQMGVDLAVEQTPDLIVSDVMMPEKDGYELTKSLKEDERTDHIPIVLLTAKADFDSKIIGLEKGADAYLAKPFEKRELLVRLEKLLELRKKLQARYAQLPAPDEALAKIEDPFLQKLYALVEKELSNSDLDMAKLCRSLGMSRSQVFRKLKALTGKSPTVFIRSIRLQKGKQLLATSDLTVSEVAYDVGFTSPNYFSAAFFEEFGVRPSVVRK